MFHVKQVKIMTSRQYWIVICPPPDSDVCMAFKKRIPHGLKESTIIFAWDYRTAKRFYSIEAAADFAAWLRSINPQYAEATWCPWPPAEEPSRSRLH